MPKCQHKDCDNIVKFQKFRSGYSNFCSLKCAHNSEKVREKTKQTNRERYDCEYTLQTEEVKEQMKTLFQIRTYLKDKLY